MQNVATLHASEAYGDSRSKAPVILNLSTKHGLMVSDTACYPLYSRLGGPHTLGYTKIVDIACTCQKSKHDSSVVQPIA